MDTGSKISLVGASLIAIGVISLLSLAFVFSVTLGVILLGMTLIFVGGVAMVFGADY